ncbi:MAG: DUF2142 domain-containing protein [Armatimonadota bacterium]|nr:DUF2142 domain-containing protein [Armatimonadota bacterium]MCX7778171.1 DUF2142 domain-containing protein [Armatimonadota bacterium]MDW8026571.1 DUF2142 domain-containing protein [Armatimonadota bacterium]
MAKRKRQKRTGTTVSNRLRYRSLERAAGAAKPLFSITAQPFSLRQFIVPLRHPFVAMLICAYLAICIGYALVTPFGRAPDENAHHFYVRHIVERHSLPKMQKGDDWHEAHQPPLFYLLASPIYVFSKLLAKVCRMSELEATVWALRLFCIICGAVTVLASYHLAELLLQGAKIYAQVALAFAATHAMHAFINSSINSDNFAEALCSIFMLWLLGTMFSRRMEIKDAITLGVFVGLIAITKYFAWSALAGIAVALTWNVRRYGIKASECASYILIALLVTISISIWWYVRNTLLYGDPLGRRVYESLSEHAAQPAWFFALGYTMVDYFALAAKYLFWTFWGLFGLTDIFLPSWAYWLWLVPTVLCIVGIALFVWRWRRSIYELDEATCWRWLTLICWFGALLFLYFIFLLHYFSAQMRHLFLMFALIAVLFSIGIVEWLPLRIRERYQAFLPHAIAIGMLAYNAVCILIIIPNAYR